MSAGAPPPPSSRHHHGADHDHAQHRGPDLPAAGLLRHRHGPLRHRLLPLRLRRADGVRDAQLLLLDHPAAHPQQAPETRKEPRRLEVP